MSWLTRTERQPFGVRWQSESEPFPASFRGDTALQRFGVRRATSSLSSRDEQRL